ncbi:MAG: permease, partial [Gammaproteobacteria bacterium]|nr:permease [Gammaproteobacteria bacterium]
MTITILLAGLAILGLVFTPLLLAEARKRGELRPDPESIGIGAVTNFFDTLGIGSFATTTAWVKFRALVPDSFIPATLNVGHSLPTIVQAAIFLVILGVHVDPVLLASCIVAAVAGSLLGVPIVVKAPVRVVQGVVGVALLIAACLYAMSNLDLMPIGGDATALP